MVVLRRRAAEVGCGCHGWNKLHARGEDELAVDSKLQGRWKLVAAAASHSRRGGAVLSILAARTVAETLLVTVVSVLVLLRERWRKKLGTRGGGKNGGALPWLSRCGEDGGARSCWAREEDGVAVRGGRRGDGGGGCHGGWKERRKLGLGFWEMKMMTWQNLIG
ncbi:hypothetical protein DEO72_LG5g1226 [Vigna unguiculata]|uniref:Uncharacterized protein n=1 Tax=Vigna unguiculata TaxID=3917 RepID=A0A4D6LWV4_VIGUN|nr:hypothetical protein DEO72_LG5g1226 [Vigna unguiculata]